MQVSFFWVRRHGTEALTHVISVVHPRSPQLSLCREAEPKRLSSQDDFLQLFAVQQFQHGKDETWKYCAL